MSPDLCELWRYGCPDSPEWDSEMDVCSVEEEVGKVMDLGSCILGARWCPLHAHDCSKMEHRWAAWTFY